MSLKSLIISLLIMLYCTIVNGQKTGLVLSGGGAKGLAHIGVLKALEENNIPIDYIVGTSMGGIIGGMYAAGFSPDQIDSIATSQEFLHWVDGEIPDQYQVYYIKSEPVPKWLEINLGVDSTLDAQFNPRLANDVALNFALAEHMAAANQAADADFSQLFVPFTAIGAEIFTQKTVLMNSGNLGATMRATMSVPFVYRPIRIKGQYIFDGGIYNNFPVEPMKELHMPDNIIGVNVSSKIYDTYPEQLDQKLISSSLLYMMMDKADPGTLGEGDFYIEPNLEGYSGFDFKDSRSIIDSGYIAAMRELPQILNGVEQRSNPEMLKEARLKFMNKQKPLEFSGISLEGFNKKQQTYIRKVLSDDAGSHLSIDDIRENYYNLVAEPYFSDVFPEINYDKETKRYIFSLYSDKNEKIRLQLGGNISTGGLSNIFIGAKLDVLGKWLYSHNINGRIGEFYKSFQYNLRVNIPSGFPFYLEPYFVYNSWNYLGISSFLTDISVTDIVQFDRNYGLNFTFPFKQRYKLNLKTSFLQKNSSYGNTIEFQSSDTLDVSHFNGMHNAITFNYNNLNERIFPVRGTKFKISISQNLGYEKYAPGSTSDLAVVTDFHHWLQLNAYYENYWPLSIGSIGVIGDFKASSMGSFQNLYGTLLNTPTYNPTFESPSLFLENFRSPLFIAGGLKYQFPIYNSLSFRAEVHGFKPLFKWEERENYVRWSNLSPKYHLASMASLIYSTPVGPVSLSAHYYDDENPFFLMLNIGFLMFNQKPLE